jgi:hypothetical protein
MCQQLYLWRFEGKPKMELVILLSGCSPVSLAEIQESGTLQIVFIVLEFVKYFIQSCENYCWLEKFCILHTCSVYSS